jgi:formylglycine-generating enzyme required for sulfatase activity
MRGLLIILLLAGCSSPRPGVIRNSLGMELISVPSLSVLVCRHETRVRDYAVFARETRRQWPEAGFHQSGAHPAVNVSWRDAKAFCEWLGVREGRRYRLPTDAEWSMLAGVRHLERRGVSPVAQPPLPGHHPFGNRPLAAGDANLCDISFGSSAFGDGYEASWIRGHKDGYAATAPVGSFKQDANGLHDLSGNVWEWCEDWYDPPKNTLKVLRGASWRTGNPERIWASYRGPDPPSCRLDSVGFRVVLEP